MDNSPTENNRVMIDQKLVIKDKEKMAYAMKTLREESGIRQKDIAEELGIPRSRYNRAEVGEVRLTIDQVHRLIAFYRKKKQLVDYNFIFENDKTSLKLKKQLKDCQKTIDDLNNQIKNLETQLKDKDKIITLLESSTTEA